MSMRIEVDGRGIEACPGDTVAVALLRAGVRFGGSLSGRGLFCGMGSCFECHAEVDGRPHTRTCLISVHDGMRVRTGKSEEGA